MPTTLTDSQSATLALAAADPGDVRLELYDSNANLLAIGAAAANVEQILNHFVDTTNDGLPSAYFVRVVGITADYDLLLIKNADFDREPNDAIDQGIQDITVNGIVLGSVIPLLSRSDDSGSDTVSFPTILVDGERFLWDIQATGSIGRGTDYAYDGGLNHINFPPFGPGHNRQ